MAFEVAVDGTPTNGTSAWIDGLVAGGAWDDADGGPVTISYGFGGEGQSPEFANEVGWYGYEEVAIRQALDAFAAVANVTFVEVDAADADMGFWLTNGFELGGGLLDADMPGQGIDGEDPDEDDANDDFSIAFNWQGAGWNENGLVEGGFGFRSILHGIGLGLGLGNPHDGGPSDDANNFPGVNVSTDTGLFNLNQGIYTIMSWNRPLEAEPNSSFGFGWLGGPMALDIYALQLLYGANMDHATGDDVYQLPTADGVGTFWTTIWDAGGIDTISHQGGISDAVIDLRAADTTGEFAGGRISRAGDVEGGFTIAHGAEIENAQGGNGNDLIWGNVFDNLLEGFGGNDLIFGLAGNDTLMGGTGNDRLIGGLGNDDLTGGAGSDRMVGGFGDDVYTVDSASDAVEEGLDQGSDTVVSLLASYTLGEHLENLRFDVAGTPDEVAGIGNQLSNIVTGATEVENTLSGLGGNDTLTGGIFADLLDGGIGDDRLVGNAGADTLLGGEGADSLDGSTGDDTLDGGDGDDALIGGSGNDSLSGGLGADELFGDTGDDELDGGDGEDRLLSGSGSDVLRGGAGDDELFADTGDDDLDGGDGNDIVDGGAGSDTLAGGLGNDLMIGGTGNDTMSGGRGNDVYRADNAQDMVVELADEGVDHVISEIAFYAMTAHVEILSFDLSSSTANITGIGNDSANKMTGGAGVSNTLSGGLGDDILNGRELADTLVGQGGRDLLRGRDGDDVLEGGGGRDNLQGQAGDDTLKGGAKRDKLDGGSGNDGLVGGTGNDSLRGSGGNDMLEGGGGNDTLRGGAGNDLLIGGRGDDTLFGQGGADTFRFVRGRTDSDEIAGFNAAEDRLEIDLRGASEQTVSFSTQGGDTLISFGSSDSVRILDQLLDETDLTITYL